MTQIRKLLRPMRLLLAPLLAAGLFMGMLAQASAHSSYQRSDPAPDSVLDTPPAQLHVWFVEAPDPKQSTLTVYDASHQPVGSAAATPDPSDSTELTLPLALPGPGVYTVLWQTVSAVDGDSAHGFFSFAVGPLSTGGPGVSFDPQPAGDLQVGLSLAPGAVGANTVRVQVADATGAAPATVQRVMLRLHPPAQELGEREVIAPADPAGGFAAPGLLLGLPGTWTIEVRVRRAGQDDVSTQFSVPIAAPPGAPATPAQ